jgi:hypothetical protein
MAVLVVITTTLQLCQNIDNRSCGELQEELRFVFAKRRGCYTAMTYEGLVAGKAISLTDKPLNILI